MKETLSEQFGRFLNEGNPDRHLKDVDFLKAMYKKENAIMEESRRSEQERCKRRDFKSAILNAGFTGSRADDIYNQFAYLENPLETFIKALAEATR
jgi:hypothetical protein